MMRATCWPDALLWQRRIVIAPGAITVKGQSHCLSRHSRVEAESFHPRMAPALLCVALGMLGVPLVLMFDNLIRSDLSWLLLIPAGMFFGASLRILTAESTYCVVLRTPGANEILIFKSGDHQLVVSLVAAIRSGLEQAHLRPCPEQAVH
jgi:hypothetical protein